MSERRSNAICAFVKRPDRNCRPSDDLVSEMFVFALIKCDKRSCFYFFRIVIDRQI